MGNGDDDSAATRAQQQDNIAYEVATGEHLDDHTASAGITIRPGRGVESVRVRVPGLDEFEINPADLHDWLQRAGLIHTPPQWTAIDEQLQQAIQGHPAPTQHHGPGTGNYQWEDYATRHNQPTLTEPEREAVDEEQTQAWTRMLQGWQQFADQVHDLRGVTGGDAESIIRQVGHTITALNMIENNDWASPYSEEFAAWEGPVRRRPRAGSPARGGRRHRRGRRGAVRAVACRDRGRRLQLLPPVPGPARLHRQLRAGPGRVAARRPGRVAARRRGIRGLGG